MAAGVGCRGDSAALWKCLPASQLTFPHPLCHRHLTKIDLPIISTVRLKNKSPIPLSHTTNAVEKCKSKLQGDITSHLSEWPSAKKSTNNKSWRRCGERGTLLHCWWESKLVQPLWRTVWRCLKKLKRVTV